MEDSRFLPKISGYLEKKGKKRAESMEEQNKWMQAVMSALNQNSNATKLCHFRYSLGELPQREEHKPLVRQNTLPRRPITNDSSKGDMLYKLQKFGAYNYIDSSESDQGNLSPTKRLSNKKSQSQESLPLQHDYRSSIMEENPEYITVEPKKVHSVESVQTSEDIYERIPSNESVFSKCDPDIPIRKKDFSNSDFRENSNFRENSIYSVVNTDNISNNSKAIYSEPNLEENCVPEILDFNENNVDADVENTEYIALDSPNTPNRNIIGSDSSTSGSPTTVDKTENQYEYLDNPLYTEPEYNRCSSSSDASNHAAKKTSTSCRFKNFTKRLTSRANQKIKENKQPVPEDITQPINRKKSRSFIRRVWTKQKTKRKDSIDENDYEEPPRLIEDHKKIDTVTDENAVQILSEMKNLLEKKLPSLQKHISSSESSEQTQLENKISISEDGEDAVFSSSENVCPLLPPRIPRQRIKSPYHDIPKNNSSVTKIPPKMKKNLDKITIDDILTQLDVQNPQQTKSTTLEEVQKSKIDQETETEEGKVKKLIKKFSEEEVEIRQKISRQKIVREDTEQDELSRLLDELAKVTSAPLMTPGVTSSLITGTISDEEWLKLIPIRCRRASDPDYDIPRSHRSLPNLPKREENALTATRFFGPILNPTDIDNINKHKNLPEPTKSNNEEDTTFSLSITPDSLEPDLYTPHSSSGAATEESHCGEDRNTSYHSREVNGNISYNSHDYLEQKNNTQNMFPKNMHVWQKNEDENEFFIENCLYECPKMLNALNKNKVKHQIVSASKNPAKTATTSDDEADVFVDSLEVYAEIGRTAF